MSLKIIFFLFLLGSWTWITPVHALDWECPQMKEFVDSMYDLGDFIEQTPNFDETPKFESGMNTLVKVLDAIAKDEEKPPFTNSVSTMKKLWNLDTWDEKQRNAFRRAFDSVSLGLERIYTQYCP